jgi:hypothetical protein
MTRGESASPYPDDESVIPGPERSEGAPESILRVFGKHPDDHREAAAYGFRARRSAAPRNDGQAFGIMTRGEAPSPGPLRGSNLSPQAGEVK